MNPPRVLAQPLAVALLAMLSLPATAAPEQSSERSLVERAEQLIQAALQSDRNTERGAGLYRQHCADCHGPVAHGDPARFIPALAGQRQAYLIKQLADFTTLQRDSRDMHAVLSADGPNDAQAWADLAAWLNGLAVAQFAHSDDRQSVALGEGIFREQCASCHELDGRGDDEGFVPSLRNQHHLYLMRQMHRLAAWHRLHVDDGLVRFLGSLDTEERRGLADYLSGLRGPVRDRSIMHEDGTVGD